MHRGSSVVALCVQQWAQRVCRYEWHAGGVIEWCCAINERLVPLLQAMMMGMDPSEMEMMGMEMGMGGGGLPPVRPSSPTAGSALEG